MQLLQAGKCKQHGFLSPLLPWYSISGTFSPVSQDECFYLLLISRVNEQLKDMIAEKEWWLKEVHHRVKNNFHTIICLLESQATYLEKDALQAIEKSQHRIYAMSLIHQKLYQNENLQVIDMSESATGNTGCSDYK
ncbi:histidine kinase dimerization/phosphoacceptor domain -containing protein [Flavitalea sp.]|nr:histidine kinase dimerization/phosphoacceptor domain -containing protein [Flavitalea sp.]